MKKINVKTKGKRPSKSSKSVSKALKLRGGFIPTSAIRPFIMKGIADVAIKAGNKINKGYDPLAALSSAIREEVMVKVNGKFVEMIQAPPQGTVGTGNYRKQVPSVLENQVVKPTVMPLRAGDQAKKSYRTKFESGRPTTQTLRDLGKEQGIRREVVFDSKVYNPFPTGEGGETDAYPREYLLNGHGFNTRTFCVLPELASVSRNQIKKLVKLGQEFVTTASPINEDQTIYGALMNTKSRIELVNQNRFFPIEFKIHVVVRNGQGYDGNNLNTSLADIIKEKVVIFEGSTPVVEDPGTGEVTGGLQTVPANFAGIPTYFLCGFDISRGSVNAKTYSWEQLRSGRGLESSPWFRENLTVVKTVSKKLEPGETWQFAHVHHYGAGYDFPANWIQNTLTELYGSANYNYIIESSGYPCEGVQNTIADGTVKVPRLGTTPGRWFYDFQTEVEYVQGATTSKELGTDATNSSKKFYAPVRAGMHLRVFDNDKAGYLNPEKIRPFFKTLPNVSDIPTTTPGDFYIPVEAQTYILTDGSGTTSDTGLYERTGYGYKIG